MGRAHSQLSIAPLLVLIRWGGVEKSTIIRIEVRMTVLMRLIILPLNRSYRELSKIPIGFLLTTITSRESDVGGVGSGTGGVVVVVRGWESCCCCCRGSIVWEVVLCFIVCWLGIVWVLLWCIINDGNNTTINLP
jgi:hypothetical protein